LLTGARATFLLPISDANGHIRFADFFYLDFQLQFAKETWLEERNAWKAVIQLNLVRSINSIVELLSNELAQRPSSPTSSQSGRPGTADKYGLHSNGASSPPLFDFTEQHRVLRLRLAPLKNVQTDLERRIGAVSEEVKPGPVSEAFTEALPLPPQLTVREAYVQSRDGWRSALAKMRPRQSHEESTRLSEQRARLDAEVTEVMAGCAEDMKTLWEDRVVRDLLKRKKIRMEDAPGLFVRFASFIETFGANMLPW
jgi:guanine nucleotide-binding protein alpha-1 subunit